MKKNAIGSIIAAVIILLVGYGIVSYVARASDQRAQEEIDETADTTADAAAKPLESGTYTINTEASKMTWEGRKTLIESYVDTGTLQLVEGSITVDDDRATEATFVFDMTSIAASATGSGKGEDMLSTHLKSADFFDVEEYPTATFVLTSATPGADVATNHNYTVTGDLTLKGITKEISFPSAMYMKDGNFVSEAVLELDRTTWDVRYGSDSFFSNLGNNVIDDMFTVAFTVVAK